MVRQTLGSLGVKVKSTGVSSFERLPKLFFYLLYWSVNPIDNPKTPNLLSEEKSSIYMLLLF